MIEIKALSKKYKNAESFAVEDLYLTIEEGEIYGLLGPNGAGKTTLISMLTSLIRPTSGTFSIQGLNFKDHRKQLRQLIGVVPQEYAIYPTLTAYENLMYFGSMYGLKGTALKTNVLDHLDIMGLRKFAHKKTVHFSGGMKRRVNLLAGVLHRPRVLFLDEPTVGVDVQSKNSILSFLKNLNQEGTTIIYTSHHLNEAEAFCTQVAIIDDGRILKRGNPSDLIAQQEYARSLEDVFLIETGKELRDHA